MMPDIIIGVDLGGTRVRVARLGPELNILQREEILTLADRGFDATIARIIDFIGTVLPEDHSSVAGIGFSVPGPLNPRTGVLVAPPNLPGWHNVPLQQIMEDAFHLPIFLGNDANVAALAEAARGAARGFRHVIYITISTGIGSGIIVDGRLLLGSEGLAGEFGHIALVCGEKSQLSTPEKEAAGPALARRARMLITQGRESTITAVVDGDLSRIDGRAVGQAAVAGDPLALDVVQRGGHFVGLGIASLLHLFNPEVIVIGGGVSKSWDVLYPPMMEAIKSAVIDSAYWEKLHIERAVLDEDVSIIGAAALVATHGGVWDLTKVLATLNG
jgi:glucokinase